MYTIISIRSQTSEQSMLLWVASCPSCETSLFFHTSIGYIR
ncbi:hypothetical protein [Moorena sp. SIOASIH]|nr:hypothetical protein [Moorena sp. SIOASIH]